MVWSLLERTHRVDECRIIRTRRQRRAKHVLIDRSEVSWSSRRHIRTVHHQVTAGPVAMENAVVVQGDVDAPRGHNNSGAAHGQTRVCAKRKRGAVSEGCHCPPGITTTERRNLRPKNTHASCKHDSRRAPCHNAYRKYLFVA